jgi:hypothetical protein
VARHILHRGAHNCLLRSNGVPAAEPLHPALVLSASYASGLDAEYSAGSVTGTAIGGTAVSGGYAVLDGTSKGVRYTVTAGDTYSTTKGTLILRPKWNSVTGPGGSGYQSVFWVGDGAGSTANSAAVIWYNDGGTMKLVMYHFNSGGGSINDHAGAPAWSPADTSTTYEIAMTYDHVGNVSRLFVDGVVIRTWSHAAVTKTAAVSGFHYVGPQYTGTDRFLNANVDSYRVYNDVLWTSDYTP